MGWLESCTAGAAADYGYRGFVASIDKLVMGRKTYNQVLGFGAWPYDEKECSVFTKRPLEQPPPRVESYEGTPRQWTDSLPPGRDERVWLVGGGGLAASFAAADLIDEYLLFLMPCLLGRGVPLLGTAGADLATAIQKLSLLECHRFADGVVKLHYRRASANSSG